MEPHIVCLVRVSLPIEEFREELQEIPGATLVREFAPGRLVVRLPAEAAVERLAALRGVEAVAPDRLEHPDR